MLMHEDHQISIFFGDIHTSILSGQYYNIGSSEALLTQEPFQTLSNLMQLHQVAVLKQTHSTLGYVITKSDVLPYEHEGDYFITQLIHVGLAVITADCLPILLFDPVTCTIAAVHAGWRGTVDGIATIVLAEMQRLYKVNLATVQIFFGPSAKKCCYEVSEDFVAQYAQQQFAVCAIQRHGCWYFDVPLYNKIVFMQAGLAEDAFRMSYNICTMCDLSFCSYRRDAQSTKRQVTIIALR